MLKPLPALSASVALCALAIGLPGFPIASRADAQALSVSPAETLEGRGLSVIIDQNQFSPIFFDEKNAGIQIVLHGERIATDGAVRLDKTPEQWAPVPAFLGRSVDRATNTVIVRSAYKAQDLGYRVRVTPEGDGAFRIAVDLDRPLPAAMAGKAGFNLDFLPSSYFGKTYLMDAAGGLFPRHPTGPMAKDGSGDPLPLASGGHSLTLAPEDPLTRVSITSDTGPLSLFDARARAQNGWFVVRSEIAAGAKDDAVVWHVRPNLVKDWVRQPVVSFNQAGYTPGRAKVALIELDPNFPAPREAELVRLGSDGEQVVLRAATSPRGRYTRYDYAAFDFSSVRASGVYAIRYAGRTTNPFRIAADAYARIWQTSLDTFIAEQMDHMGIREQYRVWSAPSHLDDARQAPPNHVHFDGYRMGPNLDSPFKPGEHIPGLAVGGFQDAGDYDIQTPENAQVVRDLVWARELYGLDWDETSIDETARAVEVRKPDGVEDAVQQIRHGTLQLLAQYKVFGHAIVGIVDPALRQYAHLGDAGSQTDGRRFDAALKPGEVRDDASGTADDRWAFTTDLPANNLAVAGALAAASRALRPSDPAMADEALAAAKTLWARQQTGKVQSGDGRDDSASPRSAEVANVVATVELLLTTKDRVYADRLRRLQPVIARTFAFTAGPAVRALPLMDARYRAAIAGAVRTFKAQTDRDLASNPFGVPITEGSWAGSNQVVSFGATMHLLHGAFPAIVGNDYTLNAIDYVLGRHPANNLSLVSTVGTASKLIGYGHNRADYSFIPGGLVPGVLIVKPDLPEAKTDWPFLWFENEYTVSTTSAYILAARAAEASAAEVR